jgi:hypothetical protein
MAKFILLAVIECFTSMVVSAADLLAVAGHYRYEEYSVTLPNGRTLRLSDLGATEGFLDISEADSITLRMTMHAGKTIQTAKVLEAHIAQGKGYWIAQWPDMKSPVKAQITLVAGVLTTDTRFEDRSDPERFGSAEHAVLRKIVAK